MTPEEMTLHRQLLAAVNDYIKHNLKWETKGFRKDSTRARQALRRAIDLAYLRWKEIYNIREGKAENMEIGKEFFRELSKKQKRSKLKGEDNTST